MIFWFKSIISVRFTHSAYAFGLIFMVLGSANQKAALETTLQWFLSGFIYRGHMSPCFGKMGDTWMILGDKIVHKPQKLHLI